MTRIRRLPAATLLALAVLAGFAAALTGLYLLADLVRPGAGIGVTLLVGGIVLVVGGLVVDLD